MKANEATPPWTPGRVRWTREWEEEGRPCFRIGRDGDELVAEWVGMGVLRASRTGDRRQFTPAPGVDPARVEKFHRGLVNAMLRHLDGKVTLHASAVAFEGVAVALAGESGTGKSTTAASLCREPGVELLADDTLAVERDPGGFVVLPTETTHWLTAETARAFGLDPSGSFKAQVSPARCAPGAVPLVAIVRLAFDPACPEPRCRRLQGRDAFKLLSAGLFRFVIDEQGAAVRDFEHLAAIAGGVSIFELTRRPDLEDLTPTGRVVRELARACRRSAA